MSDINTVRDHAKADQQAQQARGFQLVRRHSDGTFLYVPPLVAVYGGDVLEHWLFRDGEWYTLNQEHTGFVNEHGEYLRFRQSYGR